MSRLTGKDYIEQVRYELIEDVGETYSDSYILRMVSEGCRRFISGIPLGAGINLEPMFYVWGNKITTIVLTTDSDSVTIPGDVRRVWKVTVDGAEYNYATYEDFDDYTSGPCYTIDSDGLRFQAPLKAGATVKMRISSYDVTLNVANQGDTFGIIRQADEPFLIGYAVGMAKRRNEYSATLAEQYIDEFNEGVSLARREGDVAIANDISTAQVATGFFT